MSFAVYMTQSPMFVCMQCRGKHPLHARTWVKGIGMMCKTCSEKFFHCSGCNRAFSRDRDSYLVDKDMRLCADCNQRLRFFLPGPDFVADDCTRIQTKRRFGVELESSTNPDFQAIHLRNESVFGAKSDCTCTGREFYSPILAGDGGLNAVERLCQLAEKYGWTVDTACGYHLHIDVQDESLDALRSIQYAFANLYDLLIRCVNSDRRSSTFCKNYTHPDSVEEADDLLNFFDRTQRYNYLNVNSYRSHGTFENRLHEGTFDQRATCNWIILNMRITEAAKQHSIADLKAMLYGKTLEDVWEVVKDWIGDNEIISFYEARMLENQFSS